MTLPYRQMQGLVTAGLVTADLETAVR